MQAVILAAGESSRFWPLNTRHKSLVKIMGRPVIEYTISGLISAGVEDVIVVQSQKRDIESELGKLENVRYVVQKEPRGMGNALMRAAKLLKNEFIVINAERFDAGEFLKKIMLARKTTGADMAILGAKTKEPWLYGILKLEGRRVVEMVEKPPKGKEPSDVKAAGIYLLNTGFFEYYNETNEHMYSFEDALGKCMAGRKVVVEMADKEVFSLKYPWHIFSVERALMEKHLKRKISKKAKVSKTAIIEGEVYVCDGAKILENAVVRGPVYVGEGCLVGNNAVVRECVDVEKNCIIGANAEVARSIIQENSHMHSGFVGDSIIGRNCRIGAGFITANVRLDKGFVRSVVKGEKVDTGLRSFGCVVGDNTKMGIGVKTMPGVMIGSNCKIGPSTVIADNVESSTVLYSKFQKIVKKKGGSA